MRFQSRMMIRRILLLCAILATIALALLGLYNSTQLVTLQSQNDTLLLVQAMMAVGFGALLVSLALLWLTLEQAYKHNYNDVFFSSEAQVPNKAYFVSQLTPRLAVKRSLAVVYFSINNFKAIVERMGLDFAVGLQRQMTKEMRRHLDKGEMLAHVGNGQYLMMLECQTPAELEIRLQIFGRLAETVKPDTEMTFTLRLTFGTCFVKVGTVTTAEAVIKAAADSLAALHSRVSSRPLDSSPISYTSDKFDFAIALANGKFRTRYVPVYTADGRRFGNELQLYMQTDKGLLISSRFMPIAYKEGKADMIYDWMRHAACSDCANFNKQNNGAVLPLIIRLSKSEQRNPTVISDYLRVAESYKLSPSNFIFELPQSAIFGELMLFVAFVEKLREAGFGVMVSGFDFEPTSANKLKRFYFNMLKYDSFQLKSLLQHPDRAKSAVESLARLRESKPDLQLMAINVEDANDEAIIARLKVNYYSRSESVAATYGKSGTGPITAAR